MKHFLDGNVVGYSFSGAKYWDVWVALVWSRAGKFHQLASTHQGSNLAIVYLGTNSVDCLHYQLAHERHYNEYDQACD